MAKALPPVWFTSLLDSNGHLLNGGKIQSYAGGTTTPLATYSNSTGSANTNPLVLDSAGRGSLWLTQGISYKFVLSDSANNVLFTVDNIIAGQADAGSPYYVHVCFLGDAPSVSQVIGKHVFGVAVSFTADLPDAVFCNVGTPPDSDTDFDMQFNGVSFGTLTIDALGAVSADCTAQDFDLGDVFRLIAPDVATATANIAITINGVVS